jgi:hypothetical protein
MPIRRVLISSFSGDEIAPGTGARVRVMYNDPNRPDRRADLTDEEVDQLLPFATDVITRPSRRRRAAQ